MTVDAEKPCGSHRTGRQLSRRGFLRTFGAAAAGMLVAACRSERSAEIAAAPTEAGATPTSTVAVQPAHTPTDVPTAGPTHTPTASPTASPTAVPTIAPAVSVRRPAAEVAIATAHNYERKRIYEGVREMLDGLGGLRDVVRAGDSVAIKTNLTGGLYFEPPEGLLATESYLTHPEVVRALCELLRDAGARTLHIVEAVYDAESYKVFGYEEVAADVGATLVDLNRPDPYEDFAFAAVGDGWQIYDGFTFNHVLLEADAFVSVAKQKCHYNAGVTHAMKNLVGLVPASGYALDKSHWWRSALHGHSDEETRVRLPQVIIDLNRARPIDLALIDGVMTGEGGEAPRGSFAPVAPGVLIASKDAVAADAVATAAMGFDPTIDPPNPPFLRGDNYLNLAHSLGMGTNRLEEIEVLGASIDDVVYPFRPSTRM